MKRRRKKEIKKERKRRKERVGQKGRKRREEWSHTLCTSIRPCYRPSVLYTHPSVCQSRAVSRRCLCVRTKKTKHEQESAAIQFRTGLIARSRRDVSSCILRNSCTQQISNTVTQKTFWKVLTGVSFILWLSENHPSLRQNSVCLPFPTLKKVLKTTQVMFFFQHPSGKSAGSALRSIALVMLSCSTSFLLRVD